MYRFFNLKRILPLIVAGFLVTGSLFGCSSNGKQKSQTNEKSSTTVQPKQETKPTLKYLGQYLPDDPNKRFEASAIEKATGYKVIYEMLSQDKPQEKLNLIIASGEPYDVITAQNNLKEYCFEFARRGALVDLGPLMDKYAPRLKTVISEKSFNLFKVDNKSYFVPSKIALEYIDKGLLIRQDWLDTLNLKQPKTLDEFVAVLKAFKEKDPGNNGEKNIPFSLTAPDQVHGLIGAFGIALNWNVVDGKIVAKEELPGFKEYLEFMATLYKEGLIDREMPVNKGNTVQEKFTGGRVGVISYSAFSIGIVADALKKSVPDAKYAFIEPLTGKNGQQGVYQTAGYDYLTFIPKSSKLQEDAMKWIGLKLEQDSFKKTTIGDEGVHHAVKDGIYSAILPKFNDDYGEAYYYLTGTDEKAYEKYWIARLQRDPRTYENFMKLQNGVGKYSRLDVIKLASNVPNFTKNELTLSSTSSEFMTKVIAGAEPVSSIDGYVKKWKEAGGDVSTKEINEWYKLYLQSNK